MNSNFDNLEYVQLLMSGVNEQFLKTSNLPEDWILDKNDIEIKNVKVDYKNTTLNDDSFDWDYFQITFTNKLEELDLIEELAKIDNNKIKKITISAKIKITDKPLYKCSGSILLNNTPLVINIIR